MQNNKTIKLIFSSLVFCWILISTAYATTQQWRDIVNQLRDDWWSDKEIRTVMENLWYDANDYLWRNLTSKWQELYKQLKDQWRKEERIEQTMESLWYYTNSWNDSIETISSYTSRSCKVYNIEYISNLGVYTSSDLKNKEYFINSDYLKRYIDSKNTQKYNCPNNKWRIKNFYNDTSSRTDRYIAPNWKVYFIINQNWSYTSNELATTKSFWTINELKNYIRNRNSLIYIWNTY